MRAIIVDKSVARILGRIKEPGVFAWTWRARPIALGRLGKHTERASTGKAAI